MIKASTLLKRPSLIRQIQLGGRDAVIDVRTVDELKFLFSEGLLQRVRLHLHDFSWQDFFESADTWDEKELQTCVNNGSFRWALLKHLQALRNTLTAELPPNLIAALVTCHPETIKVLAHTLNPDSLRCLYRMTRRESGLTELAGPWILERVIELAQVQNSYILPLKNKLLDLALEILSDEERLLVNLRVLVDLVYEDDLQYMQGPLLETFTRLSSREDAVGLLAMMLLPEEKMREFADSPNPLKRAIVASRSKDTTLLEKLSRSADIEVQLPLLARGRFVEVAVERILGRRDKLAEIVLPVILRKALK